jgi:hypothetical protein
MQLERERHTMMRSWAEREEQLNLAVGSMAGLYGDPQVLAGAGIQEIEGIDVPRLQAPKAAQPAEGGANHGKR